MILDLVRVFRTEYFWRMHNSSKIVVPLYTFGVWIGKPQASPRLPRIRSCSVNIGPVENIHEAHCCESDWSF